MDANVVSIKTLLDGPSETLTIELKTWLDLQRPEHKAKIIRALLALRNRNGGYLLIGFNNQSLQPDPMPDGYDPRVAFYSDKVQLLVSQHASEPFAINVEIQERDGQHHPVIVVQSGVQYPVAVKSRICDAAGKELLKEGEVPFRTLRSNGTVSTAAARPADWREITEICFQNREADIGAFVRRHLSGTNLPDLVQAFALRVQPAQELPTLREQCKEMMEAGLGRFRSVLESRGSSDARRAAAEWGTWEFALAISPSVTGRVSDRALLL